MLRKLWNKWIFADFFFSLTNEVVFSCVYGPSLWGCSSYRLDTSSSNSNLFTHRLQNWWGYTSEMQATMFSSYRKCSYVGRSGQFDLRGAIPIVVKLWVIGFFYEEQPPAMSRSPQIKMTRWQNTAKWGREMYDWKYSLLNEITSWRLCSVVSRGCVTRIRLWSFRRDDHSGILIGAGGTQRSDWPVRVLANDVRTRINR